MADTLSHQNGVKDWSVISFKPCSSCKACPHPHAHLRNGSRGVPTPVMSVVAGLALLKEVAVDKENLLRLEQELRKAGLPQVLTTAEGDVETLFERFDRWIASSLHL